VLVLEYSSAVVGRGYADAMVGLIVGADVVVGLIVSVVVGLIVDGLILWLD